MTRSVTSTRRIGFATLMAGVAILSITAVAAGAYSPSMTLRTAADGVALNVQDMASKGGDVVVAWEEAQAAGPASFMRLSDDGGATYSPRFRLGYEGALVREAEVDACAGQAFAISAVAPAEHPDRWDVGLAYASFDGIGDNPEDNFLGFDNETNARHPDVACVGNRALAGAWLDASHSPARVELLIREMEFCGDECTEPGFWNRYDLGPGRVADGVSVAATSDDVYVTWVRDDHVRIKHFSLGGPGAVTPHPTVTLSGMKPGAAAPELAASASHLVLIYGAQNDARVRVSEDGGVTFGPRHTYVDGPSVGSAFAYPTSVDIRGTHIWLEGTYVIFHVGDPTPDVTAWSAESIDGGAGWTRDHQLIAGDKIGVLADVGGIERAAEAWDDSWSDVDRQMLRSRYKLP